MIRLSVRARLGIAVPSILFLALSGIAPLLTESHESLAAHSACSDGMDNDRNGRTDYPQDSACDSLDDAFEGMGTSAVFASVTDGREIVRPGDSLIYIVSLLHQRDEWKNVDVDLHIPAEVDLLDVSDGGRILAHRVQWDGITLQKNITKKLTVQARVRTTASQGHLVVARLSTEGTIATDTTRVEGLTYGAQPLFRATVSDGVDFISSKQTLTYIIAAENLTESERTTRVMAFLPENVTVTDEPADAWFDGHRITWSPVTFGPRERRVFRFQVQTSDRPRDYLPVYMRAQVDGVAASDTTIMRSGFPLHALSVTLTSDRDSAVRGDLITYDVTVRNTVTEPSTEAMVNASLPVYGEFVSVTEGGFWDGSSIHWRNLQIAPDGQRTLRYTVRVRSDAPIGARLYASADVDGARDSVTTNVVHALPVAMEDPAVPSSKLSTRQQRLLLHKTAESTEALPGARIRYTISVQNVLLHPIRDAIVADRFNPSFMTAIDTGGADVVSAGELEWSIPELEPGQTWRQSYVLAVLPEVPHGTSINNIARITGKDVADASFQERVTVTQTGVVAELPSTGAPLDMFLLLSLFPAAFVPAMLQRRRMVS